MTRMLPSLRFLIESSALTLELRFGLEASLKFEVWRFCRGSMRHIFPIEPHAQRLPPAESAKSLLRQSEPAAG
jgi:hypothetical protein